MDRHGAEGDQELELPPGVLHEPTRPWLGPHRPLLRRLTGSVVEFLDVEAAGGIVLFAAALLAILWANSPWGATYEQFWTREVAVSIGGFRISNDLRHWVNEALMVIFFFVVGLEIKGELVAGELSDRRRAVLPIAAAVGGMAVPALAYLLVNPGGEGVAGWGIPVATDIAFALGVVALLGPRVPSNLKTFLLALAIVDDVGQF